MNQGKSSPFTNAFAIASYTDETPRKVPGLADLHRMTMLLLAEQAPETAHILVVGAGGGMETGAMAAAQPGWRFTGVDPSPAMLNLARQMLSPFADRIDLIEGTVDRAPAGPFNGATCLLTLHHIEPSERLRTLREIRLRLKPGAPIVVASHSAPGADPESWMRRSVAFANRSALDWTNATNVARMMSDRLHLLSPAKEEEVLREAGFVDVEMFYAAFSFRGWVGIAG